MRWNGVDCAGTNTFIAVARYTNIYTTMTLRIALQVTPSAVVVIK